MSDKIVVMHVRASNFVGGPEKQILEHFVRLDRDRFEPILVTYVEDGQSDPLGEAAIHQGFRCIRLPSQSPLHPGAVARLAGQMKREKVDILCTHGYKPNVLGCLAARLSGAATIAISRGWTWESQKIRLYESIDRFFLKFCDHVVAVSHGQREKILTCGVKPERISVIHNAISLEEVPTSEKSDIRQQLGIPADALFVASAGRLSPEKNYRTMIEVASITASQNRSIYFAIFGEGFLRQELEQQITRAGLSGRFFLPGFRTDIASLLREIDLFMLPSLTEGLPNVVLEAFAARKPVLASRVGGTPEVVDHGVSGYLTAPEDVQQMAHYLRELEDSPELRARFGAAGYAATRERFGFEQQTKEYEALYAQVMQIKKGAGTR